ncbi:MAG: DNA-3-methyladenine glycosylase I [Chitinophagales bacterium]|nr:DNA-3-methyladenine glycosylase I [Bacteroidota bacterium]MCB9256803.1 DNA-3-methyladenine glycosylase I [Chitinophagales bacterium]
MSNNRCAWANGDALYEKYHDEEWGVPIHDDRLLFEFLCLEGAQAGLSWITILRKRENYRALFANFEADKLVQFSDKNLEEILQNPGIIRNRLKVFSVRQNAQAFLEVQKEFGSFDKFIWSFVNNTVIAKQHLDLSTIPAQTKESEAMSKALKKRGFNFVGATICYAFMQAAGLVNDHTETCFRNSQV